MLIAGNLIFYFPKAATPKGAVGLSLENCFLPYGLTA